MHGGYSIRESKLPSQCVRMTGGKMTSEVQSLLFDRRKWTPEKVKKWIKEHPQYHMRKMDITDRFIRVRQKSPKEFPMFRTITFSDRKGIKAVIGLERK